MADYLPPQLEQAFMVTVSEYLLRLRDHSRSAVGGGDGKLLFVFFPFCLLPLFHAHDLFVLFASSPQFTLGSAGSSLSRLSSEQNEDSPHLF